MRNIKILLLEQRFREYKDRRKMSSEELEKGVGNKKEVLISEWSTLESIMLESAK